DFVFFFQAEDGIRDPLVTGVHTCALPILCGILEPVIAVLAVYRGGNVPLHRHRHRVQPGFGDDVANEDVAVDLAAYRAVGGGIKIGRASCRERVEKWGGDVEVTENVEVGW